VTAADASDMWIHEGWATYLECLYVEHVFGYDDALRYVNGYKSRVQNRTPIITPRGIHRLPQDMYFKGALFLNTLRTVVNDDSLWRKLLHDVYQRFKYRTILTEDLVRFFNEKTRMDLTPIFDQYLRYSRIPTLQLKFSEQDNVVSYRWDADAKGFAMPVRVGKKGEWRMIQPSAEWKTTPWRAGRDEFEVATDLYYINVER
jgi:aminopeptidase N